jgi:hypothetical protein
MFLLLRNFEMQCIRINILTINNVSYIYLLVIVAVISYIQIIYEKLEWGLLLIDFN